MMYNPIVESEVVIGYLADRPEFVERIARLSWDEWRWIYQNRGATFEYVLKKYRERTNIDRLPLAFVATARVNDRDELVGTISLKPQDLEIRTDLANWLGSAFVLPEWRRRGIASRLVQHAVDQARKLGIARLHLWTESAAAEALYLKLGWEVIERTDYYGQRIVVMGIGTQVGSRITR